MPSSISNSNPRPLDRKRSRVLLLGLLLGLVGLFLVELGMRAVGVSPGVKDNSGLWALKRSQASSLGEEAIILVGASRIQLGTDVEVLETVTGRPVIQLAIDGSELTPVLDDLAADSSLRGDVIIAASLEKLARSRPDDISQQWLQYYHRAFRGLFFPEWEQFLKTQLQSHLATYSNLIPPEIMIGRMWQGKNMPKIYLHTQTNRERVADYQLVKQPDFYIRRVMRVLGMALPDSAFQDMASFSAAVLKKGRQHISPISSAPEAYSRAAAAIAALRRRGNRVSLIRFPTSGLVRQLEDMREPVDVWRKVTMDLDASAVVDFRDYPGLQMKLADGSHLDKTQRREFTMRLLAVLEQLGGFVSAPVSNQ